MKVTDNGIPSQAGFTQFLVNVLGQPDVPVEFSNLSLKNLLGLVRLVTDPLGLPLGDPNYVAQLYRVDVVPEVVVADFLGELPQARFVSQAPGYFVGGGTRTLLGVGPGQAVQLEVRVWDKTAFAQ